MPYKRSHPPATPALFHSVCDECEGDVWEGELISFDEVSKEWLHLECLEYLLALEE